VRAGADPPADNQIRDYQSALSYLERREDVDENRLGAWGISYSGGHVLILAIPGRRPWSRRSRSSNGYENMRRAHGSRGYRQLWSVILVLN
jgi:dipeptidyl aminopeptidase/acylaminoacyl peptidase